MKTGPSICVDIRDGGCGGETQYPQLSESPLKATKQLPKRNPPSTPPLLWNKVICTRLLEPFLPVPDFSPCEFFSLLRRFLLFHNAPISTFSIVLPKTRQMSLPQMMMRKKVEYVKKLHFFLSLIVRIS